MSLRTTDTATDRASGAALEAVLVAIARSSPPLMAALRAARALALAEWCVAAGAVRSLVWDHLHGLGPQTVLGEVDLVYFDAQEPDGREGALQSRLAAACPGCTWDVTNQARVHLWYGQRFGMEVPALGSMVEGMATWPEVATCVGLTLAADDALQVHAPHGLGDLFALRLRHNPARVPLQVASERIRTKRWLQRWPKLQLVGALAQAV